MLPPEIYPESARVAQFNEANRDEARELDANLLEVQQGTSQCAEVPGAPEALLQQKCCFTSARDRGPSLEERYLH
jgi:hypothetical protein